MRVAEVRVEHRRRERASMRDEEYAVLRSLLLELKPARTLEVGMANGSSAVVICDVLREVGGGKHVAIDPFQTSPEMWNGEGLRKVREAGLAEYVGLVEEFDYLALPRLAGEGRLFDFILIDGWHSFDYTLLDLFYADLLLRVGGVLAVHDTGMPAVYKACRFLETHKPYEVVGPPIGAVIPSVGGRLARRARQVLGGATTIQSARQRRREWFSLGAYRKLHDSQVPDDFFAEF